jgi:hypothetical protein
MPYVPGVLQDLFLSYAHGDDATWLRCFEQALLKGLRERLGEPAEIWRDTKEIRLGELWQDEIKTGISRTAAFLALVSPNYLSSDYCGKELSHFLKDPSVVEFSPSVAGRLRRILKVIKAPADDGAHESLLSESQYVRFFRLGDGRLGDQIFSPETTDFNNSMQETVTGIVDLLKKIRRSHQPVYLANAAGDAEEDRRTLRRELAAQGFDVRPPSTRSDLYEEPFLKKEIDEVALPVFLLKNLYDPFVERQLRLVRELEKPAVLWLPRQPPEKKAEAEQQRLLTAIRSGESLPPSSIILETPSPRTMIQEVIEVLRAPRVQPVAPAGGKSTVYLLFDATSERDSQLAKEVRRLLEQADLEVLAVSPERNGTPTGRIESHFELLRRCDAVLLCRASADDPDAWLYQTAPDVLYAERMLKRPPFLAKAFLLAQPLALGEIPDVIPLGEKLGRQDLETFLAPLRPHHAAA